MDTELDTLATALKPLVARIEAMPMTTKDHYGDYMAAISRIAPMSGDASDRKVNIAIGVALQRAGANKQGVQSALRAMGML